MIWCRSIGAKSDAGFTFVEMAVAIVVLGLALAMTLRGTALIDVFRGTITGNKLLQFQNHVLVYTMNYNALPGDDPVATRRFQREPALTYVGDRPSLLAANSIIDGKLSDFENVYGEHVTAWRDLRYAQILDGDPKLVGFSALPENPFGGIFGFDQGNLGQDNGSICATKIPGRVAQSIDERLDDGRINSGILVGTSNFAMDVYNHFEAPDAEPYNIEKEYIICIPLLP